MIWNFLFRKDLHLEVIFFKMYQCTNPEKNGFVPNRFVIEWLQNRFILYRSFSERLAISRILKRIWIPTLNLKTSWFLFHFFVDSLARRHGVKIYLFTVLQDGQFAALRNKNWSLNFLHILMIFCNENHQFFEYYIWLNIHSGLNFEWFHETLFIFHRR